MALRTGVRQRGNWLTEKHATRTRHATQVQRTWTDAANALREPGTNFCKTCLVYLQPLKRLIPQLCDARFGRKSEMGALSAAMSKHDTGPR